jgi:hypothetical protein
MVLVLSLLDGAISAQSNQQEKLDHSDGSQGIEVGAGSTTDGRRYHSDYFDFTYSLPDGFVEGTEWARSKIRALPGSHPVLMSSFCFLPTYQRRAVQIPLVRKYLLRLTGFLDTPWGHGRKITPTEQ